MAERGHPRSVLVCDQEYTFTNVQLLKNETLGTGSYGAVCKVKCDQLMCAAKLLYPVLFKMVTPDPGKEHRQPFRRFEQECQFLSHINHPNIVQYLGTYRDPETNAPVLLMELMDESLTHYLESSPGDIPYHIQVNLTSDIAQALVFLHANGIIHRDLSSNNVLLIAGSRAKVTDFGMSKFTDINRASLTKCPGTPAFMSPEALDEPPVYTEKLDTFSFGVLLIQVMTRQFPKPSDRLETMLVPNPRNPSTTVKSRIAVPETERREGHINLIEPTHPLLTIALECLKDEDVERPSSQQLCQSLEVAKVTARYEESSHQDVAELLREKDEQIQEKDEQLQANNEQIQAKDVQLQAKDEELQELATTVDTLQHEVADREAQLRRFNQQLEANEEITATLRQTIAQRDKEVREMLANIRTMGQNARQQAVEIAQATSATKGIVWRSEPDCPIPIYAFNSSLVVIGNKAYFESFRLGEFDINSKKWFEQTIPEFIPCNSTLVNVEGTLTTVGGYYENWLGKLKETNKLHSYIDGKWVEHFPPMPTKRCLPAAVCTNHTLIVVGGLIGDDKSVNVVEILNTNTMQWTKVSSLPLEPYKPSMGICGEYIYLHPRYEDYMHKDVIKCLLLDLVQSTPKSTVWERVTSLPVSLSTLVTFNGHLLALGGRDSSKQPTNNVYQYNSNTNSWQVVSQMLSALYSCSAVVLPSNELLVVGGQLNRQSVKIASLTDKFVTPWFHHSLPCII